MFLAEVTDIIQEDKWYENEFRGYWNGEGCRAEKYVLDKVELTDLGNSLCLKTQCQCFDKGA